MSPILLRQSIDLGTPGKCSVVLVDLSAMVLACALGAGPRERIQGRCIFVLSARIGRKAFSIMSRSGAPWRWHLVEDAHLLQEDRTSQSSYATSIHPSLQCYWLLATSCASY